MLNELKAKDYKVGYSVEEVSAVTEGKLGGRAFIDFHAKLTPLRGDLSLKGDPEHAGIHYRPANEVNAKLTKYVYPEGVTDVKKVKDLAWVAGEDL